MEIGTKVTVPFVRSNYLDRDNGLGWTARNVSVEVKRINDLTFCFDYNNEYHFGLISEAKPTYTNQTRLF